MFTTDPRYSVREEGRMNYYYYHHSCVQVHFYPLSGIWELRVGMLRMGDTGVYECQVLYCVLYCNELYCTVLYCTVLYPGQHPAQAAVHHPPGH